MDVTLPALSFAGPPGRVAWTAPTLTEHALFSEIAAFGPARILGLLQGSIGITCNGNPITCHPSP